MILSSSQSAMALETKENKGTELKRTKVSKQTHIVEELSETGDVIQYHCTACSKKFRSRTQKYYHLQCNRLADELYECDICKKSFARHSQLKYHRESHTSPINECFKCQKTFTNPLALKKHESLHKVEPKPCPHCDKTFMKKISLEQHIAAQHLHQLHYGCAYCNKKYSSKSTLQLHLQSHEKKRFECSFCGKLFQRNSTLSLHFKRHTQQTNAYKCQVCDKAFSESGALARHRKIHEENAIQYHCLLCDKNILRKDNMARHLTTIHPDEKYENIVQIIRPSVQKHKENDCEITEGHQIIESKCADARDTLLKNYEDKIISNDQPSIKNLVNISEENLAESQNNFIIIENKLLQRPLQSNDLQNPVTHNVHQNIGEEISNKYYGKAFTEPPAIVNHIQVITSLSSIEPPKDNNLRDLSSNNSKENYQKSENQSDCILVDKVQQQEETATKSFNDCSKLKTKDSLEGDCKSHIFQTSSYLQQNSIESEAMRNKPSVIRSIGNVKKKLTTNIVSETIMDTNVLLDHQYKHKKYSRHYNLDLYRKILGCDDDDDDDYAERNIHQGQGHQDNASESINSTTVHWRKSFKNIYETSTS